MFARHGTWPQPPEIPLSAAFVTGGESRPFMLGPVVGGRQGLRMHGTSLDWQYPAVAARAIASGRVWAWAGRLPGATRPASSSRPRRWRAPCTTSATTGTSATTAPTKGSDQRPQDGNGAPWTMTYNPLYVILGTGGA